MAGEEGSAEVIPGEDHLHGPQVASQSGISLVICNIPEKGRGTWWYPYTMKDWFVIEASEVSISGAKCGCVNLQWEMGLPGPPGSSPLCSTNMFSVWKSYMGSHGIRICWQREHILNEILQKLSGTRTRWLDICISSIKTDLLQGWGTSGLGHCWDRLWSFAICDLSCVFAFLTNRSPSG